jgi:N utilization substance protein B
MIELGSKNWSLDRMNMVDKTILQIAFYELMYEKDTPKAVVIDEAVELAKKYSEEDAPKFINGILDAAMV